LHHRLRHRIPVGLAQAGDGSSCGRREIGIIAPAFCSPTAASSTPSSGFRRSWTNCERFPRLFSGRQVPRAISIRPSRSTYAPGRDGHLCVLVLPGDLVGAVGLLDEGIFYALKTWNTAPASTKRAGTYLLSLSDAPAPHAADHPPASFVLDLAVAPEGPDSAPPRHGGWIARPANADRRWPARDDAAERYVHLTAAGPADIAGTGGGSEAASVVRA